MALKKVVILRRGFRRADGTIGYAGAVPDAFDIEEAELSDTEQQDLARDPAVAASPEAMPIRLIAPLSKTAVASTQPADAPPGGNGGAPVSTWGIKAVRADQPGGRTGKGVKIAVLDTGISRNHPAFAGVDLTIRNFTSDAIADDTDGHGTHCAATIFGRNVKGVRIGVAPGVTQVFIGKVIGANGGTLASLAKGLRWAFGEGAHIASMSIGIDYDAHLRELETRMPSAEASIQLLSNYAQCVRMFDYLCEFMMDQQGRGTGMLIVAASGNNSRRPTFAVSSTSPSASLGAISIGAIGPSEPGGGEPYVVAPFSNQFPYFAAPGVDVVSADLIDGLIAMSGTSMAAPHVAGVAALHAQQRVTADPEHFSPQTVLDDIKREGVRSLAGLETADIGHGLVQAPPM